MTTINLRLYLVLFILIHHLVAARRCTGRGTCPKGTECYRRSKCVVPEYKPLTESDFSYISEIQGDGTVSQLVGQVVSTIGVVTAIDERGTPSIWIQDIYEDSNPLTSEGLYLFRPSFAPIATPAVGDVISVRGEVKEFAGRSGDLPITEIVDGAVEIAKGDAGIVVEAVEFAPRRPLSSFGDGSGYEQDVNVERRDLVERNYRCGSLRESAICYYEAFEHMKVRVEGVAVTPELRFGEIGIAVGGKGVVGRRNFRAEIVTVEDDLVGRGERDLGVGEEVEAFDGVVFYSFSQYKVYNIEAVKKKGGVRKVPRSCPQKMTSAGSVRISAWNLLNRDAKDPKSELSAIASNFAKFQRCPDVVGLSEIGDDSGSTNDGETSAKMTLQQIADATGAACDTSYAFTDIAPVNLADGGLPGQNIRVAFMFRTDKVQLVDAAPKGGPDEAVKYDKSLQRLTLNPGRISPSSFPDSRKPLAAEFEFVGGTNRQSFIVIFNHWNSKGGDDALFGRIQPPLQKSQVERNVQAAAVKEFIDSIPSSKPLIVVGDLNDFYFSDPVKALKLHNLWLSVPSNDRFSFVFQSRSQTLDHILVRPGAVECERLCAVHSNTFSREGSSLRPTDHDPLVAVCELA